MECNKEEAIRAKAIAEHKMRNGDFDGGKKFALKAQKLFPELDNITQLFAVCNVHYCAKHNVYGSEKDWYGILQVEKSADESLIKKQFRKLALLLHPDKNKFPGAESAFKLIGEANRVLTDQATRSQYDLKCRVSVNTMPKPTSHPSNRASSVNHQPGVTNNYKNGPSQFTASNPYQQAHHLTFTAICITCRFKFQCNRDFVSRMLRCPSCGKDFIAHDLGPQGYTWTPFTNQVPSNASSQQNSGRPCVHFTHKFSGSAPIPKAGSSQAGDSKKQEKAGVKKQQSKGGYTDQKEDEFSDVKDRKKGVEMPKPTAPKAKELGTSRNDKKKRGRKSVEESDESCETGSGIEVDNVFTKEDCGDNTWATSEVNSGRPPRRSSRQKQPVSYKENLADDDDNLEIPYKKSKVTGRPDADKEKMDDEVMKKDNSGGSTNTADVCKKEVKPKASAPPGDTVRNKKQKTGDSNGKEEETVILDDNKAHQFENADESSEDVDPSQEIEYPDPEFNDFEKHRAENCFAVNQVWAIYDTLDGMPRFYARVKKVFSPGFKLRITWLEADPEEENQLNWVDQNLPVSCGKHCNGSSEICVDLPMFSHRIDPIKCDGKCFFVYPQKGETWALFKDWDVKWLSEPEKHQPPYQYDIVEVLTDFDEEVGIEVAHLDKVKGFVSIFRRTERDGVTSFKISSRELYRFSHRVPSFRMTGKERASIPVGSFELDPASLPTYLFEQVDSGDKKLDNHNAENCFSPSRLQNQKSDIETEASPFIKSTRGSSRLHKDDSIEAMSDHNSSTQPEGISISGNAVDKLNTPKKCEKNDLTTDCLKPRRSPRDLSKKGSPANTSQNDTTKDGKKHSVSNKNEKPDSFGNTEGSDSLIPPVGNLHLHERDVSTVNVTESSSISKPMSPARKTSNLECYDFKREKSEDKFAVGQVWALYSGDRTPKDYVLVRLIESTPVFRLHVTLLEACSSRKVKMPLCCGIFKDKRGPTKIVSCNDVSHQVRAEAIGDHRYKIYPRKGEVWAIYKTWNSGDSDLCKGERDIVEVLEDNEKSKKVIVLSCVNRPKSLYRTPRSQRSAAGVLEIPETEFARFSHQIPAYQHTGQDSRLRGYWELDSLAVTGITR